MEQTVRPAVVAGLASRTSPTRGAASVANARTSRLCAAQLIFVTLLCRGRRASCCARAPWLRGAITSSRWPTERATQNRERSRRPRPGHPGSPSPCIEALGYASFHAACRVATKREAEPTTPAPMVPPERSAALPGCFVERRFSPTGVKVGTPPPMGAYSNSSRCADGLVVDSVSPVRHAVAVGVHDDAVGEPLLAGIDPDWGIRGEPDRQTGARVPAEGTSLMSAQGKASDPVSPARSARWPDVDE